MSALELGELRRRVAALEAERDRLARLQGSLEASLAVLEKKVGRLAAGRPAERPRIRVPPFPRALRDVGYLPPDERPPGVSPRRRRKRKREAEDVDRTEPAVESRPAELGSGRPRLGGGGGGGRLGGERRPRSDR